MQAIDEYLQILDYNADEDIYASLAQIYYNTDKPSAIGVLKEALEKFPENASFKELLSKTYMELGNFDESLKFSTNGISTAKALLMQENNDEALKVLEKLSVKEKSKPEYFALMAEYYYNTDNDDMALEHIEKYQALDDKSPLAYQMKALVYEKQNNNYNASFCWGKYYAKKNNPDLALNEYLNAHNADRKRPEVIKEIINLYTALDDKITSIEFLEKLVELEKDDVASLKKLVNFYEEQGYQEKMLRYLLSLNEINSKDYDVLLKLAKYYESVRQMSDATEYYEKYLKFAPTSKEREQIEKKLNALTSGEEFEEEEGFLDKIIGFFTKK
jgi:tetratricopeptide (TPR) repeat protein